MITILFDLENQLLRRTDTETILNKSKHIVKAKFTINGEVWDNKERFVVFKDSWDEETIIYLGTDTEPTCVVPSSVLDGSFFKVSVYGGDLITTNEVTIPLMDSGYDKRHSIHHNCNKPTKDVFVAIFERLHAKIDNIICADNCLHLFSEGRLIESVSLPGVDEAQVIAIVTRQMQEYMKTDELEAFLNEHGYINQVYMDGDEIIFE